MRAMRYTRRSAADGAAWQRDVRARLLALLRVDDLIRYRARAPLHAVVRETRRDERGTTSEIGFASTPARRIQALLTLPAEAAVPGPAVVCIHGHGGSRTSTYERDSIYKGFATELAATGYATIATDVGRHEVYENGRTLMGERLWDLMRCVDFLCSLPEVAPDRIGCAGLSLGGEMAMWLGAMDTRVRATVSAGFLTRMDQMEHNHCMCWKLDGLRDLVDFADIYALTAPRALQCQNGEQEPPDQFPPSIARAVLPEIAAAYADLGAPDALELVAHGGGHEVELDALVEFFEKRLR